jgi:hypothetical protein
VDDWIESQIDEEEPNKWVARDLMGGSCDMLTHQLILNVCCHHGA